MNHTAAHTVGHFEDRIIDRQSLWNLIGGNMELLERVAAIFAGGKDQYIADVRAGIAENNSEHICRAAHGIKGALGNLGSTQAFLTAGLLEQAGRDHEMVRAKELCEALAAEVDSFAQCLEQFVRSPDAMRNS